jgi:hypothetical protein
MSHLNGALQQVSDETVVRTGELDSLNRQVMIGPC